MRRVTPMTFVGTIPPEEWSPKAQQLMNEGRRPYVTYFNQIIEVPPWKCKNQKMWMNEEQKQEFEEVWERYKKINYSNEMLKARDMSQADDPELKRLGKMLVLKLREDSGWQAVKDELDSIKKKYRE